MTLISDDRMKQRAKVYGEQNKPGVNWLFKLTEKRKKSGYKGETWTTEDVLEEIPEGGAVTLFTSFGEVNGVESFARSTFVREDEPFPQVVLIADRGEAVISYGPYYKFRVLVRD